MTKILITLYGMALTIALSVPAYAAGSYTGKADFKMRGWYKAEGTSADNMNFNDDVGDGRSFAYSRFRWWMDTSFDKKFGGTIGFEQDFVWGVTPNYASHTATTDALHTGGSPGQDVAGNIEIKNMYLWFFIPGTKIKATGGLQTHVIDPDLIMFGESADWWSWRLVIPLGRMGKISFAWLKQSEGVTTNVNDDADYYYLSLGLGFSRAFQFGYYSLWLQTQTTDGTPMATMGGFQIDGGYIWWNGIHIRWTPGLFYLNVHINGQTGLLDENDSTLGQAAGNSVEISGHAFLFKAGLKWQSGLRIELRGWWFTGMDNSDANPSEIDKWLDPDAFFTPMEIMYTGARFWVTGSTPGSGDPGGTNGGGFNGFIPLSKTLSLMPAIYVVNWTDAKNDSRAGVGEDILGYEIDLLLNWRPIKPSKSLVFNFLVAYVLAGDGLDPSATKSSDDAYEIGYRVVYTF